MVGVLHCTVNTRPAGPSGDLVFTYKEINKRKNNRVVEMVLQMNHFLSKDEDQSLGCSESTQRPGEREACVPE